MALNNPDMHLVSRTADPVGLMLSQLPPTGILWRSRLSSHFPVKRAAWRLLFPCRSDISSRKARNSPKVGNRNLALS